MVVSALVLAQLVSAAAACSTLSIGLTPSQADGYGSADLGMAIGQTFYAPSTEIQSLTVWRVANEDTLLDGMHLYICSVDSTGTPHPESLLLDGPTVTVPYGDGVHPIEHRFDFDPPFRLPAPGLYAFFLQASPCYGWFDVIADNKNDYQQGSKWQTQRSLSGCTLRSFPSEYPTSDLVFQIQFCDETTPVKVRSWGAIKSLYR